MTVTKSASLGSFTWLIPIAALAAGGLVGTTTARAKYKEPTLELAQHEATADPTKVAEFTPDGEPIVHLPIPSTYEFGVMARGEERSHSFKVQNIGGGPLTLTVLDTTCKCTVGDIGNDTVKPGETADVTLTWVAKSYDREFRQSATIETNDPGKYREIIFSIEGKVAQLALPDTPIMKFQRVSRTEPQSFVTKVYGYRDRDLIIAGHSFAKPEIAEFFDIKTEPLPKEEWEDSEAKSAIQVTFDIKPGLPLGRNQQIISLETNKADIPPMEVSVELIVISDISVMGKLTEFNDETNMAKFGVVDSSRAREMYLNLWVKGEYKEEVDFSVASIDPESVLEVDIGDPKDLTSTDADGNETVLTRRFPLTVRVKKDSPSVRRMGSKQGELGRIVLNTNHPEIEQFDIKVQFATQ